MAFFPFQFVIFTFRNYCKKRTDHKDDECDGAENRTIRFTILKEIPRQELCQHSTAGLISYSVIGDMIVLTRY